MPERARPDSQYMKAEVQYDEANPSRFRIKLMMGGQPAFSKWITGDNIATIHFGLDVFIAVNRTRGLDRGEKGMLLKRGVVYRVTEAEEIKGLN